MQVTLHSKTDCPLCDEVKRDLLELQDTFGFSLAENDILRDAEAFERFRHLIPVVDIDGGALLFPPHTLSTLESALRAAGRVNDGTPAR